MESFGNAAGVDLKIGLCEAALDDNLVMEIGSDEDSNGAGGLRFLGLAFPTSECAELAEASEVYEPFDDEIVDEEII